jgi:hypothetical protein
MQLRGKLVTSRLLREEQEEEENWLRRYSFAPRDKVIPLFSFFFLFCGGAEQLEQGERSDWSQRSRATRAGGAKQLKQGEQSD